MEPRQWRRWMAKAQQWMETTATAICAGKARESSPGIDIEAAPRDARRSADRECCLARCIELPHERNGQTWPGRRSNKDEGVSTAPEPTASRLPTGAAGRGLHMAAATNQRPCQAPAMAGKDCGTPRDPETCKPCSGQCSRAYPALRKAAPSSPEPCHGLGGSTKFADVDLETDSQAPLAQDDEDERSQEADTTSFWSSERNMDAPPFAASQPSPFAPQGGTSAPVDALEGEAARQATLKAEGARYNVPQFLVDAALREGVTWDTLRESLNTGFNAYATYIASGKAPDTALTPEAPATVVALETERRQQLAQQCAAATVAETPGTEDEATQVAAFMGAAGM